MFSHSKGVKFKEFRSGGCIRSMY